MSKEQYLIVTKTNFKDLNSQELHIQEISTLDSQQTC